MKKPDLYILLAELAVYQPADGELGPYILKKWPTAGNVKRDDFDELTDDNLITLLKGFHAEPHGVRDDMLDHLYALWPRGKSMLTTVYALKATGFSRTTGGYVHLHFRCVFATEELASEWIEEFNNELANSSGLSGVDFEFEVVAQDVIYGEGQGEGSS